jgi:hypothetical protein
VKKPIDESLLKLMGLLGIIKLYFFFRSFYEVLSEFEKDGDYDPSSSKDLVRYMARDVAVREFISSLGFNARIGFEAC